MDYKFLKLPYIVLFYIKNYLFKPVHNKFLFFKTGSNPFFQTGSKPFFQTSAKFLQSSPSMPPGISYTPRQKYQIQILSKIRICLLFEWSVAGQSSEL